MNGIRVTLCAAAISLAGVSAANAQTWRPYIGVEGTADQNRYPATAGQGTTVPTAQKLQGESVLLGFRIRRDLGLEFGYGTTGSATRTDPDTGFNSRIHLRHRVTLDALGYLPVGPRGIELIGLLGASQARARLSVADGDDADLSTGMIKGVHVGVGAQYTLVNHVGLRGIVERERAAFAQEGENTHVYNGWIAKVGAVYQF